MMKLTYFKNICFVILCLTLNACAAPQTMSPQVSNQALQRETHKQKELSYKRYVIDQDKLFNTAFPILRYNTNSCGKKTRPLYGLIVWNIDLIPASQRSVVRSLYHLDNELSIQNVTINSPAEDAGLKSRDVIISINGEKIPLGKTGYTLAQNILKRSGYKTSSIFYRRNGKVFSTHLKPVSGCDYPVVLDKSSAINAMADGKQVIISRGIMRFTETEHELALVIAHELAHNTMNHINKKKTNALAGTLGGLALDILASSAGIHTGNQFSKLGGNAGVMAHSIGFEQEADYVGMYFMARSGYKTHEVANFWRRMASEGSASITHARTHPTSPQRFLAIEQTHREIELKKRNNQNLMPNMRK